MELVKNIFFNTDKLIENNKVKISYTGKFFQEGSEEVYAHFGFGEQWNNVNDINMNKTELGFQAEIQLKEENTFNLCFRNENGDWDNNEGRNYIFAIEKAPKELMVIEDQPTSIAKGKKATKLYLWSKKVKLAVYKIITYLPKIISGNYKKKTMNEK